MTWTRLVNTVWKAGTVGLCIMQYGCIAHCALEYGADFVICTGPSMEPTIKSHDIVLTEHLTILLNRTKRGDVVIAKSPSNPRQYVCKRVVAMEGQRVTKSYFNTELVPKGHVWLEGDNKHNSTDSREYGAVPRGLLRGRVIWKVWPLEDFGAMKSTSKVS